MAHWLDLQRVKFAEPGLAFMLANGQREIWVLTDLRRRRTCALCPRKLAVGVSAWRSMSNRLHRAARICHGCFVALPESTPGSGDA